jgi:hypothetical protein
MVLRVKQKNPPVVFPASAPPEIIHSMTSLSCRIDYDFCPLPSSAGFVLWIEIQQVVQKYEAG